MRQPREAEWRLAGQPARPQTPRVIQPYVVGLHLGPALAPSAIVLVRRTAGATDGDPLTHRVAAAKRWPAGTRYDRLMPLVALILERAGQREGVAALAVNVTGVPESAVGLMDRLAGSVRFEAIHVTRGDRAAQGADGWHVPQRDLGGVLQALLAQERLQVPATLPEARVLVAQMDAFAGTSGRPGRDPDGPGAGGADELVTALSLACWFSETVSPALVEEASVEFSAWSQEALRSEVQKRRIGRKSPPPGGPSEGSQLLDGLS